MRRHLSKLKIGQKIGKLTFIEDMGMDENSKHLLKFVCDCGNIKISEQRVVLRAIKTGAEPSCNIGRCHPRYIDLDGLKFGKLLILKSDLLDGQVLVRCDCGIEFVSDKTSVKTGHVRSCGIGFCRPSTRDLSGQRFGYLVALKLVGSRATNGQNTQWECLCDCGKTFITLSHSLLTGNTKSCGCSSGIMYSEKTTLPNCEAIINQILDSYHRHAQKLGIDFSLTREEFENFIKDNCHYCGEPPSNVRKLKNLSGPKQFRYNGIDRKDANLGYNLNNCVSACKDCNYAKRKRSYWEYINHCKKVANNF